MSGAIPSARGSSYDCRQWAEEQKVGNVGRKATLNAIAGYAGLSDDDWTCFPGQERLARATEQGTRTIRRHVQELAEMGLLCHQSRPRANGRGRSSDRYFLHVGGECRWCEWSQDGTGPTGQIGPLVSDQPANGHRTNRPNPTTNRPEPDRRSVVRSSDVELQTSVGQVFQTWKQSTSRSDRTVLDANRRRLICRALKDYPLADVLDAVKGWEHSPHHRGENDVGKTYNDLGLLLRDATHIEQFRDLARRPRMERNGQAVAEPRTFSALAERRRLLDASAGSGEAVGLPGGGLADVPHDGRNGSGVGRALGPG